MNEIKTSPFWTVGHTPFEYKGIMYFYNTTAVDTDDFMLGLSPEEKKMMFQAGFDFRKKDKVAVGVIQRTFNDPLLPIEDDAPEELKKYLTDINGVDFWKMYYQYMEAGFVEMLKAMKDFSDFEGKEQVTDDPNSWPLQDFLFFFTFWCFGKERHLGESDKAKTDFFEAFFNNEDEGDYCRLLLADSLPEGRGYVHFVIWKK